MSSLPLSTFQIVFIVQKNLTNKIVLSKWTKSKGWTFFILPKG